LLNIQFSVTIHSNIFSKYQFLHKKNMWLTENRASW